MSDNIIFSSRTLEQYKGSKLFLSGRSNEVCNVENLSSYRYIFVLTMEKLVFENGIDDMRARDLRSLLVQKLGVDLNLVNKILDRNELKELVKTILHEKIKQKTNEEYTALAYQVSIVVGILTILYLCRNIIWGLMLSLKDILGESTYKSAKKGKLLIYNLKQKKFIAAASLSISLLIELTIMWIQWTVLLSWVLSPDHVLRRYAPPTLSFPVSANTLVRAATNGKDVNTSDSSGIGARISNFSMDVGPMLTVMALNFLVNKLDEYAAGVVLEHVRGREERKAAKRFGKKFGSGGGEDTGGSSSAQPQQQQKQETDEESVRASLNRFYGSGSSSAKSQQSTTEASSTAERAVEGLQGTDISVSDHSTSFGQID